MNMMNSTEWLAYFRQNRLDRRAIPWHEGVRLRPGLHEPLARSLATFQLGESSEGRKLRNEARRLAERTGDTAYAEAIEMFVAEEHEHSRLLARVLSLMDAPLLGRQWSDGLFRLCRHLLSFHGELCVLLMAEIVALKYYGAIRTGAGDPVLETICDQVLYDEKFHVRFHCEYLHRAVARRPAFVRAACWWALTAMFAGASTVVAWDHRAGFRALGGSATEFLRDSWRNFAAARRAIFSGEPFVWSASSGRAESPIAIPITVRILLRTASAWQHAWLATASTVRGLKMRLRKLRTTARDVPLPARAREAHRHL